MAAPRDQQGVPLWGRPPAFWPRRVFCHRTPLRSGPHLRCRARDGQGRLETQRKQRSWIFFGKLVIYKGNWGLLGTINSLIPGIDWGEQGNERVSPSGKPHGHTNQQPSKPLGLPLNWFLTNGILSSWIMTIPNNYVKGI